MLGVALDRGDVFRDDLIRRRGPPVVKQEVHAVCVEVVDAPQKGLAERPSTWTIAMLPPPVLAPPGTQQEPMPCMY